ncbi:MAG: hypothetical protein QXR53_00035 [Candidatus Norongarragalinales archaeon]
MLEQYLFMGLFIGGLLGFVLTFTRRRKKTFLFELAIALGLMVIGTFGPTIFNLPPTPYVLVPAFHFADSDDSVGAISDVFSGSKVSIDSSVNGAPVVVSSGASVQVKDSLNNIPIVAADVTAVDLASGRSITVKTNSFGIVPVKVLISGLDVGKETPTPSATVSPSGTPEEAEPTTAPQDIVITATTPSSTAEQKITVDDNNPNAVEKVDVRVDVLPPLSQSFLSETPIQSVSGGVLSAALNSPVLVPITPSGVFAPPSAFEAPGTRNRLEFVRELRVVQVVRDGQVGFLSTLEVRITNNGPDEIRDLIVEEDFQELYERIREHRRLRGAPRAVIEEEIELVGSSETPIELKSGEFARWLFSSVGPGEEVKVSYTVDTAVDESVVQRLPAPVALAVSNEPLKVVVKQESSFDTTAVIGLVLASALVLAIALFFVRRPQ